MPSVTLEATVPGADPAAVFTRLADFSAYPRYTAAVRKVTVTGVDDDIVASHWSVNFRNGVLCWSERDRIDLAALTIDFAQVDGDFERFDGTWRVTAQPAADRGDGGAHGRVGSPGPAGPAPGATQVLDVRVHFSATFDLGMPSLAAILDPVARQALTESIGLILRGLFGEHIHIAEASATVAAGG